MSNKEQPKIAMLDTSFLIRLLKEDDPLHASAMHDTRKPMDELVTRVD